MATRLIRALSIAALLVASVASPAGAATITGTSGPDVLVGTSTADTIRGYAGNDVLRGRDGADTVYGGRGADQMYGGGDRQRDLLYGGPGRDRIYATWNDFVYAGYGNDTIVVGQAEPWKMALKIWCGPGYDTVIASDAWFLSYSGCEHTVWTG